MAEFKERKSDLLAKSEGFVQEYKIVASMAFVNSGKATADVIVNIETMLSEKWKSVSLLDWEKELTFNKMLVFVCEIFNYFLSSHKTKTTLEGAELLQLVAKIYVHDKQLKVCDLIGILNNARKGNYGTDYNRVDENTFFNWMKLYKEGKSIELETEKINSKPEQSNVRELRDPKQDELEMYERMQRAKKDIRDKVNN